MSQFSNRPRALFALGVVALVVSSTLGCDSRPTPPLSQWLTPDFWQHAEIEDVKSMLDHRADVNARGNLGRTPLHMAAKLNKDPAVIKMLLDRGTDINVRNNIGSTPLHEAAQNEEPAVTKLLLNRGADVNAMTDTGQTPLRIAVHLAAGWSMENTQVIELLLDHGADVYERGSIYEPTVCELATFGEGLRGTTVLRRLCRLCR